jgi:hypothetical protein
MATFNWTISTLERDIQPADMDGAIIVSHWRCTASQENEGTTYSASSYGTVGFQPDPSSPDYIQYADVTEQDALKWTWAGGVDKDATEASLQSNIDLQMNPVTADGVPW